MKHALICFGNEESYGLLFVGGELKKYNQQIKFFDAERDENIINNLRAWNPNYINFSPMSTFFPSAYNILKEIKIKLPEIVSVFGGHHATAAPEIMDFKDIDVVVRGPVKGSIEKILKGEKGVITTIPTNPNDLSIPAREEYYENIPRMAQRYRKVMISMMGCPFVCSYCSSSSLHRKELFGSKAQKEYFLGRRSLENVMQEAKTIKKYPLEEIEWVDDDIFTGGKKDEGWLLEFIDAWKNEMAVPMYVSTTSKNSLKVSDKVLKKLKDIVNCVGLGVQAIRPESLKLFHRAWDNEKQMKNAYDRLTSFGYNVNLQAIVGLPVKDPVEDALDTLEGLKRIGPGSIVSIYPLQIYPHTHIERKAIERGFKINSECVGDTNTGITGLEFSPKDTRRLRNICKLGTMFVKYNVDKEWVRPFLDIDLNDEVSQKLSVKRYKDCVLDRLGKEKGTEVFNKIMRTTNIRY